MRSGSLGTVSSIKTTYRVFKEAGLDRSQDGHRVELWCIHNEVSADLTGSPGEGGSSKLSHLQAIGLDLSICTNQSLDMGCPWGGKEVWLWRRWLSSAESSSWRGKWLRAVGTNTLEQLGEWVLNPEKGESGWHHNYCFLHRLRAHICSLYQLSIVAQ